MKRTNIAVIGAGPKAAAIAAKAECLGNARIADIHVTVFERSAIAANWTGTSGYTDGLQRLCTPAERDLGFPYESVFGDAVTALMQAKYSWMAYAVQRQDEHSYASWLNRGGKSPPHGVFADYVRRALADSSAVVELEFEVKQLVPDHDHWRVFGGKRGVSTEYLSTRFDGIVVTGPGPAKSCFKSFAHPCLFDGESFWRNLDRVRAIAGGSAGPLVLVGGGGSAAAAAAWLVNAGFGRREIIIVANQAALYTRSNAYFESKAFDDQDLWARLGDGERKTFVDRLNRAVVWEAVADVLAQAPGLILVPGRADAIKTSGSPPLTVEVSASRPSLPSIDIEADLVVDASGFDAWWFTKLLPAPHDTKDATYWRRIADAMDHALKLPVPGFPALHAPAVSHAAGPGFTSLMVLGQLADRILAPYARRPYGTL